MIEGKIFENKTLLMLGSNVSSDDIVRYAKENGAYTIVADNLPPERSFAKLIADEHALISTGDQDALGKLIEDRKVDAILAGISEFNLLNAMDLAKKYGLHFYCNREQWDLIENKEQFRALCEKHSVPCPKTYYTGKQIPDDIWDKIKYPAVIKPVDSAASIGVHICMNEEELRKAEADAVTNSECGHLILEQFAKGQEFTAHYTIVNGEPSLSSVDNRYPVAVHEGNVTTIPVARVYPSLFLDEYMRDVNGPMLNLCKSIGVQNAILFIQGMYDPDDGFAVFEAGLRCAGEAPYRFLSRINGVNNIHVLVEHAFLGKSVSFDNQKEDPAVKGKCCGVVSFVARGGIVGAIKGLEEAVAATPSVLEYESRYPVGSQTPDTDTLRQLMIRFVMVCDSREDMARDVAYLNNHITVLNNKGEDMVIKMKPERLFDIY